MIVPQISGQARKYRIECPGSAVPSSIARSCVSTLPPGPNQLRPLAENDGQALMNTVTIIATISTSVSDGERTEHELGAPVGGGAPARTAEGPAEACTNWAMCSPGGHRLLSGPRSSSS